MRVFLLLSFLLALGYCGQALTPNRLQALFLDDRGNHQFAVRA